jgi:hypothetical protein
MRRQSGLLSGIMYLHAMMQRPMIADMAIVVDAVLAISRRCGEGSAKDRPQCSGMVNHEDLIMSI